MPERQPNSKVFPKSGGFEKLKSYQVAELLYDVTVRFVKRNRTRQPYQGPNGAGGA